MLPSHPRLGRTIPIVGVVLIVAFLWAMPCCAAEPAKLSVLLLGNDGHHRPAEMARTLRPVLAGAGIHMDYTADVAALTPAALAHYDVVAIYRDGGDLPAAQEAALLDFIEGGKGLVAIHCASHCFRNSDRYTALVGGRFLRHGTGTFRGRIIDAQHPAMRGLTSFETWDETYVHNLLAADIRVLMVREEEGGYEPYTWVRQQGKGRVFYTAFGHDERTWKNAGFQKLLEQGLRWAAGRVEADPVKPFQYVEANVPHYLPDKPGGTIGEPIKQMQRPLEPAESMKHMHLPEGFEVQLYAAEPDIARPIAMAWDARGRLWIAETEDYPNDLQPPGQGHDRIKICEDTDGDGRADRFTIFADKLSIPTSLAFANGGLVVAQAPDTLFLKDSRGGDQADTRRVLFHGWGTNDTHAVASNLHWGFDNWIWGTVGYSGFEGEVGGRRQKFGQGLYRFRPDGSQMEFLTSTSNNTWGLGFSESGQVFASTANNQHSVHLAIPNRTFEGVRGWHGQGSLSIEDHKKFHPVTEDIRQVDVHGGYTAACGHALYTARSFPPEYWNRAAFVCEPTGHLVHLDWLTSHGSGFVARDGWNLLASDDAWTAPIMAEVGPDGALWVIDWYNYIVQHNPTPAGFKTGKGGAYLTPLRDKTRGRIYRIVYRGAAAGQNLHLDRAAPRELVTALGHENLWWRLTAQRLLVERGRPDVVPWLEAQVRDSRKGPAALHSLWTLHGLGVFATPGPEELEVLRLALASPDPAVRRAALQVLPRSAKSVAMILAARCLADEEPAVRLEALLALGEMPGSSDAAPAVVALLLETRNTSDPWIPQAAISAAASSDLDFLQAAVLVQPKADVVEPFSNAVRVVAGHLARRAPVDAGGALLAALGKAPPPVAEALLAGLAAGWPADRPARLDRQADTELAVLSRRLSAGGLSQLAALLRRWGQQNKLQGMTANLERSLRATVSDHGLATEARLAAARELITLSGEAAVVNVVLEQITPQADPSLTRGLLEVVGQSSADEVGAILVKRWPELTPGLRASSVALLLHRPVWTRALLAGLEQGAVDKADLSIDQAQQLSRHPDAAIAARARKLLTDSGRLPSPDRQQVLTALLPLAKRHGNGAAGKLVFEKNCAKCHRFGDVGASVGPDLTGIAVRDRADILTDILDPNRSVEGNFRQYTVETRQGLLLTGLLAGETKTTVELLDSEAKKHVVLREDIESMLASKRSLMPEGFEKLPEAELVSLLDFLTAREKFLPLPLGKAATATSVRGMFIDHGHDVERLVFPTWGRQTAFGIPFQVIDPRDGTVPNAIVLYSPQGTVSREMPRSVSIPCNAPAAAIHLLSGVSGWGYPLGEKDSVSLIVRLHYTDGKTEDHELLNGVHFADYIRVVDVPRSRLAFHLRGQQLRYLAITPRRAAAIERIEFLKGPDHTAPVVMAVTIEARE